MVFIFDKSEHLIEIQNDLVVSAVIFETFDHFALLFVEIFAGFVKYLEIDFWNATAHAIRHYGDHLF